MRGGDGLAGFLKWENRNMTNVTLTFELPAEVAVVRNGAHVSVAAAKFSAEMMAAIFVHGLVAKIGDSAAGAATKAPAEKMSAADWSGATMQKVLDALYAGNWGRKRSAGDGRPDYWGFVREIMRKALAKSPERAAKYKASDAEGRTEVLDDWFDEQSETVREQIETKAKAMLAAEIAAKTERDRFVAGFEIA